MQLYYLTKQSKVLLDSLIWLSWLTSSNFPDLYTNQAIQINSLTYTGYFSKNNLDK